MFNRLLITFGAIVIVISLGMAALISFRTHNGLLPFSTGFVVVAVIVGFAVLFFWGIVLEFIRFPLGSQKRIEEIRRRKTVSRT